MALLFVVILRNMVAVNWSAEHFIEMLPDVVCVYYLRFHFLLF